MGTRAEHVTIHQIHGSKVLAVYCGHCTGALRLALPVPVSELVTATEQFVARHQARHDLARVEDMEEEL